MKLKTNVIQKAIVRFDGKILLLKRSNTDVRRPLQWDLPGGLLDAGEELYQGVAREVLEEAGLSFENGHVVYSQTEVRQWIDENNTHHETNNVWLYYAGTANSDKVTLSYEHTEFVWVTIEEAIKLLEYPRQIEVLQYVINNQLEL